MNNFNIYGRLITKRKKGCSYYYSLLNANAKKDGWVRCKLQLEDDFFEEGIDWKYDECTVLKIVMQVLKTPYLNRLKQFYLRLIRNNLFFGKRSKTIMNADPSLCFMCGKHQERRVPILYSCEVVSKLTQTLIKILKRANLLKNGTQMEIFLFKYYEFNSIENLSLVLLWNYVY